VSQLSRSRRERIELELQVGGNTDEPGARVPDPTEGIQCDDVSRDDIGQIQLDPSGRARAGIEQIRHVSVLHAARDTNGPDVTFIEDLDSALHIRVTRKSVAREDLPDHERHMPIFTDFRAVSPRPVLHTRATITACCDSLSAAREGCPFRLLSAPRAKSFQARRDGSAPLTRPGEQEVVSKPVESALRRTPVRLKPAPTRF
jgi:hypothetical protein